MHSTVVVTQGKLQFARSIKHL